MCKRANAKKNETILRKPRAQIVLYVWQYCCMFKCIHICIQGCSHVQYTSKKHTRQTYMYVNVYVYTYIYIYMYIHIYIYVYKVRRFDLEPPIHLNHRPLEHEYVCAAVVRQQQNECLRLGINTPVNAQTPKQKLTNSHKHSNGHKQTHAYDHKHMHTGARQNTDTRAFTQAQHAHLHKCAHTHTRYMSIRTTN